MTTILTVLRSGGDFKPEHVVRLYDQWHQWGPADSRFLCLTDMKLPDFINTEELQFGWPGWWSKIECFDYQGPILYMDLDTTIVGDLAPLCQVAKEHRFTALRDFNPQSREMGSGLMAWCGDMSFVMSQFMKAPERFMRECRTSKHWGDQGFIEPLTTGRTYWQNLLPGKVVSWKKHCRGGVPDGVSVICFHGKPRPWDVK
jgi:hypothetical protein